MAEKILIVDDDLDTVRLAGLILQRQGYEIVTASNGHQALVMVQSERPDLVLLDVMMPDMDGLEVARRLRADLRTRRIPIVMFSAKNEVEDKILGFEAGADGYVTKPAHPHELFAHIREVLKRSITAPQPSIPTVERGYVVGVTAARGGLGVTTVALNLAFALRYTTKKNVAAAEFRPGQGSLALEMGLSEPGSLTRLMERPMGEIDAACLSSELVEHPAGIRLLLASSQPAEARFANALDRFGLLTRQLAARGGLAVIDLGPSMTPANEKVLSMCDEAVVVIDPSPLTLAKTKALLAALPTLGLAGERVRLVMVSRPRATYAANDVQEALGVEISATLPMDEELAYAASEQHIPMTLLQPNSETARQFTQLAEKIGERAARNVT